jgi:ATP-binding protein involved in chromosome partitioning
MSYGFAAQNKTAVMRGPMASNLVAQLVGNTKWGALDYLVVDFPPGTGDIQLTLGQELQVRGGVIVTTP